MAIRWGIVFLSFLFLSACGTTGSNSKSRSFSIQGCAAGGLGLGALAYLEYRNDPDRDKKVATISAIGCIAGSVVGYKIGKRTESYANAQQASKKEIERNRLNTANLQALNAGISRNIKEIHRQITALKKANFSAQDEREQRKQLKRSFGKQKTAADSALTSVVEELRQARAQYSRFASASPSTDRATWSNQIASLDQEKTILSRHITSLNALDSSI